MQVEDFKATLPDVPHEKLIKLRDVANDRINELRAELMEAYQHLGAVCSEIQSRLPKVGSFGA